MSNCHAQGKSRTLGRILHALLHALPYHNYAIFHLEVDSRKNSGARIAIRKMDDVRMEQIMFVSVHGYKNAIYSRYVFYATLYGALLRQKHYNFIQNNNILIILV